MLSKWESRTGCWLQTIPNGSISDKELEPEQLCHYAHYLVRLAMYVLGMSKTLTEGSSALVFILEQAIFDQVLETLPGSFSLSDGRLQIISSNAC